MELRTLIDSLGIQTVEGMDNPEVDNIQSDSRKVGKGSLFVAVRGTTTDGHAYIESAIEKGAVAVVCEEVPEALKEKATFIVVKDSAAVLGLLLATWYDYPSDKLILVGVTGTNGKTTIATLLYEMFRTMGHKVGLLSTVCNYIDGKAIPAEHTTPDPETLQNLLAQMVDAGCEYAFMEVSSHAIDQKRISGLSFDGGIFTNLTRDHLDYHKTVENYLKAKKKFFDDLPATAFALTNTDDKAGLVMLQNTAAKQLTYSLRTMADFKGKILESHFEGTELLINGKEVMVHFVGRFNAYNLLAVYGAAVALGKEPAEVLLVLSSLRSVSGRFETIPSPLGYTAIVDYAHTPDALVNVLNGIHEVLEGRGRIISVVGAGGNRDKGKRPIMAKEAARLSDQVILTSDNPRFEEPDDIINDMVAGLSKADLEHTLCITGRAQAIKTATALARKGDVILVAGKGHEDYQEIKGVKHHFDDREKLKEIFASQKI
ncbi:UDP-N-acetylmuramoyl-L-alanyl-D-glutamate--2,6-diaminopimelate ligase [Parabacteroides sp. PF5-5]|uniref:UDP-N-acetylmuramoyl-L-alanyl-D-glutamate--2, 6-diaminopimelate ligase n=1 Tax=unclassified Parabacteroides TaxID=2649774 RepID=UPI0024754919|nr:MULTISPECIES: UDP-N-acetylmuramoyl-L-alanyl-D-glutamate--2,6-diaminopimelate ligase [unclassified Parabacteroides]MDH6303377.1 UDP-N-acetylmuramoyl-L-alanyl-D-glutamate--2,6-diaminopimelate ligase [Parabacteroides sp. PH5-39]MDH6314700.1 UDP-N-acetylmuramoyl-L-alanyl-D-glutamate--2,6-diaminopimelate ligase [Parabacteroides sp. PF5-13]MDH6318037.1 UDP-N-acetylmuramoyl-L-alanyl-D-glutamate--2,6-diaminopimelate ligase [Parabacteroides sp. PH5-13]MDH6322032.1 UDP-N-acetylmuramoyl-L-alanyl-D-glut